MTAFLRLRQLCLVAKELEPAIEDLKEVFGLEVCYRDGAVAKYGLHNALVPIDAQFVEVVAPTEPGTAAGRYLERRRGDGGYMVILDCDDPAPWRKHVAEIGVRIANPIEHEGKYIGLQLHPRDTGGAMLEINWTPGGADLRGAYTPAGPDWQKAVRTDVTRAITGVEMQSDDPAELAERWGRILKRPISAGKDGERRIALDLGEIRFVKAEDGRGEGLGGIDIAASDASRIFANAKRRGCKVTGNTITICGTRFRVS